MIRHFIAIAITVAICLTVCEGCKNDPSDNGDDPADGGLLAAFDMNSLRESLPADPTLIPWQTAHALAMASQLAYESDDDITGQAKEWGFTDVEPLHVESMAAFVASNDDVMLVVFRGTDSSEMDDLLVDIDVEGYPYPPGKIHQGFRDGHAMLRNRMDKAIRRQTRPGQKIWTTGHSLGGALAIVFMLEHREDPGLEITGAITFGQPMVVDEGLGRAFRKAHFGKLIRFVNQSDIVPVILGWFNYEHVGNLVWFADDDKVDVEFEKRLRRSAKSSDAKTDAQPAIAKAPIPRELRPITKEEFERLKRQLKNQPRQRRAAAGPDGDKRLYGGSIPWFEDHKITNYVGRVEKEMDKEESAGSVGHGNQ